MGALRAGGWTIWATDLSPGALSLADPASLQVRVVDAYLVGEEAWEAAAGKTGTVGCGCVMCAAAGRGVGGSMMEAEDRTMQRFCLLGYGCAGHPGRLKAADRHAAAVCCCPQLPHRLAVVVGTESSGISREMRDAADRWGARCGRQGWLGQHHLLWYQGTLDSLLLLLLPQLQQDCTVQFASHAGTKRWAG